MELYMISTSKTSFVKDKKEIFLDKKNINI